MYDFIKYSDTDYETATSYIDEAEVKAINTYNAMINFTDISLITDEDLRIMLINATQILDTLLPYGGLKQLETQRLEFPRDFETPVFIINDNIQLAQAYICAAIANGTLNTIIVEESGREVKKEVADVLEKEYFQGGSSKPTMFVNNPYLEQLLYQFVDSCGVKVIPRYRN